MTGGCERIVVVALVVDSHLVSGQSFAILLLYKVNIPVQNKHSIAQADLIRVQALPLVSKVLLQRIHSPKQVVEGR